ncbi:hypothetical protein [Alloactinosynnema sp. L-07]|uniref:DUF2933 domain-containing protein n=1 Tax=Alloactinosynnema sp. L-07 TaxID=1653480 RepID=UPI00065EF2E9|nr:DUF2933 domain-containing protein [Alloactinosynnema sp. L-07]CRK55283.1 hypothetical protein [Alloactinosynnema sp. L-07]
MCLNKKVLIAVGVVTVAVLVLRPSWIGAALPLLLLSVCAVTMAFMMRGMNGGRPGANGKAMTTRSVDTRAVDHAAVEDRGNRAAKHTVE